MKGDPRIISVMNDLLAEELTAINQYMVHSEMCDDWGYEKLHKEIEQRAITEMKHAEKLIGRILFLEGAPIVNELRKITIGSDVPEMFANDHILEANCIVAYNAAITLCGELLDHATRDLLMGILNDEDSHIDHIEANRDEIQQLSLPVYLSTRI
ncbi:MAG: bacterioferritin [Dehalococcoidia bacterium]|nr:bacterioferritin [Dehalococcoidia bacterium]